MKVQDKNEYLRKGWYNVIVYVSNFCCNKGSYLHSFIFSLSHTVRTLKVYIYVVTSKLCISLNDVFFNTTLDAKSSKKKTLVNVPTNI